MAKDNKLQIIYNSFNKMYKAVTNKIVMNIVFVSCVAFMFFGIVLLVLGLVITSLPKIAREVISIFGASLAGLFFLLFYIFEYLRRRTNIFISKKFNMVDLCSQHLTDNGLINKEPYVVEQYKNEFITQHVEYGSRQKNERIISREFLLYGLENDQRLLLYSQAKMNEIDKNKKFSINNPNQVIIAIKNESNIEQSLIVQKDKYSFNKTMYKNKFEHEGYDIYTNDLNQNNFSYIINKLKQFEKLGIIVDVKIDSQLIYFCLSVNDNFVCLLPNFKFYKITWDEIFKQYESDIDTLTNILSIL